MLISPLIEATFIEECENRFICIVDINGQEVECYIPNTSKISKYISLNNKKVLLTKNKNVKGRTKYTLFGIEYNNSFILLNANFVNQIIETSIESSDLLDLSDYKIFKEKKINNYRADLVLENNKSKIIIEGKGIISTESSILFPTVYSERFIKQLLSIRNFLQRGWTVHYYLVSLSPFVKEIALDKSKKTYYSLINACINDGMLLRAFSVIYTGSKIEFKNFITINYFG